MKTVTLELKEQKLKCCKENHEGDSGSTARAICGVVEAVMQTGQPRISLR